ncbi:M24 family metallopeptidase [Streptomyces marispadix]|uniref:Xaa-Pro peptidase family protein n=1 Tax=Streptomyces marispadix TaxID=2922868 RepID=A0ABS9T5S0_9ACTN|nr:Xaa-Pro peptidase family protein [Streptomyces marispadix]MCH6163889.1 Xaa-Pro peptidase family protein [Streptomyces marispadix]
MTADLLAPDAGGTGGADRAASVSATASAAAPVLGGAASPVPAAEFAGRIAALRAAMRRRGLAALALASPENVHYLLGLDHLGHFAFTLLVLPRSGPPVLVARRMERRTLREQVPHVRHALYGDGSDPARVAARELERLCPAGSTVGVEEQSMAFPPAVLARIRGRLPGLSWADCSALPARLRRVKSPAEAALVRSAAEVSGVAMRAALDAADVGVSERYVAAQVQRAMTEAGGQQPGFVPLIRSTSRLGQEHVTWREHRIAPGEGLFVELSGCVHRYHAPMSRTVYCADPPPDAHVAADAAFAGLAAARAALVPGALTGAVYAAWSRAVEEATGRRPRRHHCGYLTGAGFPPSWVGGGPVLGIRAGGRTRVRAGMVFHLMSWVEHPAGYVVSDTALVGPSGCELLTGTPFAPPGLLAPAAFPGPAEH